MKKSLIISSVVSLLLVFGACSSSKDEEIERLKAENEALRASVSQQTESSLTTSETTVVTTASLTETEATTTALSDEEQVQKLIENFTSHLSTFYKNVEVSYDSDTNYFIATASVKDADSLLSAKYVYEWSNFVDAATERYAAIRDAISDNIPKAKLKLYLLSDSDSSEMLTIKGNTITYNALKDVYSGKVPGTNGSSNNKPSYSQPASKPTKGEENALKAAKNYLDVMPFSYSGLVKQLEFEKYSTSEAEYAADHCGADWNEQAAKKAQDYLDLMSFSREGLIDQLKFEGFTQSQAEYGVDAVY